MNMKDFKNKVVVVTGAGSGMGRAYATEFGKLGAKLALNDYEEGPLNETLEILKNQGVTEVYSEAFDVSNKEKMFAFADNVKSTFGNAHVVINNAGIEGSVKTAYDTTVDDYHKIMNINFFGVVHHLENIGFYKLNISKTKISFHGKNFGKRMYEI